MAKICFLSEVWQWAWVNVTGGRDIECVTFATLEGDFEKENNLKRNNSYRHTLRHLVGYFVKDPNVIGGI